MPRRSIEDLAGEAWRARGPDPVLSPPAYLKGVARTVYLEVAGHYPAGRFPPGASHLLEVFACTTAAVRSASARMLAADPAAPGYNKIVAQFVKLASVQTGVAVKLRLCPSSAWRAADGRLDEKRPKPSNYLAKMTN